MGGSMIDDDWELSFPSNALRTVVLVGKTGNGKSATGNSILGSKLFKSYASFSGVTSACELRRTTLVDGQIVNVIDTPGFFDFTHGSGTIGKEIANCINLASDGIHAVLLVLSIRNRFSKEEEASLHSLQALFGEKIISYMIVIFTGGDELDDGQTLEDYLCHGCPPEPLKKLLSACNKRMVLFDNKTKNERVRAEQVRKLFSLVDLVVASNGGKPYSDDLFAELKDGVSRLQGRDGTNGDSGYSHDGSLNRIIEMIELKLKEYTERLDIQERELMEEKAARLEAQRIARELLEAEKAAREKAEESARDDKKQQQEEIRRLREALEDAKNKAAEKSGGCSIL